MFVDPYSGAVLGDLPKGDYGNLPLMARGCLVGLMGRACETSIHVGQELGRANQLAMLLACVAIVVMSVAAVAMWWKRRPAGALGAPRYPQDYRVPRGVVAIAAIAAVVLPLMGLSLLVMLAVDLVLPERLR